jgi:DNA-binding NarL/FixJ family response regulator
MIRIGIIDDDRILCNTFDRVCATSQGLSCIIISESIASFFLHFDEKTGLDVLILDLNFNDQTEAMDHITKIRKLCGEHLKIIIYSGIIDDALMGKALDENVDGILKKDKNLNELLVAIRKVHNGENYICNSITTLMFHAVRSSKVKKHLIEKENRQIEFLRLKGLTPREVSIALKLVQGQSYAEIASSFFISINTVRYYVKLIYKKTGCSNKTSISNLLLQLYQSDHSETIPHQSESS